MKIKFAILFVFVFAAYILISSPAAKAEYLFAFIDSGSDYSSDSSTDEGDSVQFFDNATGIKAEINRQILDKGSYDSLRDYYNDYSLSERELFDRFTELKNSYINALQAFYYTNYMSSDRKNSETAMQINYSGTEVLYGLNNCSVYFYNIIQYEGLSSKEQVHLDMVIPDRARNTVITIKFIIPKDKLSAAVNGTIGSMLSGFRFEGLPQQTQAPAVLNDKPTVEKAQLGVYPAPFQKKPVYTAFENASAGFSVSLPSTYVPYIQNSLGGVFTYTSFKIDPNRIFSISSEPFQGSGMSDVLMRFKVTSYGSVKILENSTKKFDGNSYSYLSYVSTIDGLKQYYQDYYIRYGNRLYKLQLQSAFAEPGNIVMDQIAKILANFSSYSAVASETSDQSTKSAIVATTRYLNSEEGYSFSYPKSWRLDDVSTDIAYDRLRLLIPGLSGALDVSVQESELKQIVTFTDIVKSVNGKAVTSWPNLAVNYDPPFKGKTSKLLYSDFSISGPVSTIYRLSVFVDDNGRNRLCYSVDIMKGRKLYSMFITTGEYKTTSGRFNDEQVNNLINMVAASFRLETTPELDARRAAGETRNRKLVFVENYLKHTIDPRLIITAVDKIQPDGTFFATIGNTGEGGFYKIRLDYPNRQVTVIGSVLRRNILKDELVLLKDLYRGKTIVSAVQNESNMTLTIDARENAGSADVVRTFQVNAYTDGNLVKWQTIRLAHQEDYMWECENYINSLFSSPTHVYYEGKNIFTDMEPYKQKSAIYRFMTYVESSRSPGFLVLKMDPRSSLFTTKGGFVTLDTVVEDIRTIYGIKYLSHRSDAIDFNTDSFVLTLRTADKLGNDTLIEQYKIQYNMDKGIIEYLKMN